MGGVVTKVQEEVADELQFHFEEAIREGIEEGLDPDEARRRAHQAFGSFEHHRAALERMGRKRARMSALVEMAVSLRQTLRHTLRSASRSPLLTGGIVLTWALGFGLNGATFGVVDRLLLRPPPHVHAPDELRLVGMALSTSAPPASTVQPLANYPDFAALRDHPGLDLTAYTQAFDLTIGSGMSATRAPVAGVFPGFFHVLGARPVTGRAFGEQPSAQAGLRDALISFEVWRTAYGGDPAAVGAQVEIGGTLHTIVGVAPKGFTGLGLERVDYWVPLYVSDRLEELTSPLPLPGLGLCVTSRRCRWIRTVGRIRDEGSEAATVAEGSRLISNARRVDGESETRVDMVFESIRSAASGSLGAADVRLAFWLVGLSLLVLVIASANVTTLLLARSLKDRGNVALKILLGAGRRRVIAETVAETLLLSIGAAAVALLTTRWSRRLLQPYILPDAHFFDVGPDLRLTGFLLAMAGLSALLSALAPALIGLRPDRAFNLAKRSLGQGGGRSRVLTWCTNGQVALCAVLLVSAGLFTKSLTRVEAVELGLDVPGLAQATVVFEDPFLDTRHSIALYQRARDAVAAIPGVAEAALTTAPLGLASTIDVAVPGLDSIASPGGEDPYAQYVSGGFFSVSGIRITRGRAIRAGDPPNVTVLEEPMARSLWPDSEAVGQCIYLYGTRECTRVVGVAEPAIQVRFGGPPAFALYLPQDGESPYQAIYFRTSGDAESLLAAVSSAIDDTAPEILTSKVETVASILEPQTRSWRRGSSLLSVLGLLALVLSGFGLYAVLAFDVVSRTHELGVQSALGAGRRRLVFDVMTRAFWLTRGGLLGGAVTCYMIAPYLQPQLFQVDARDPAVFAAVLALMVSAAVAGALLPAGRAMNADPIVALRAE